MKPKPSISIDERGILLHLTDATGHGVTVPIDPEGLALLAEQAGKALLTLKTDKGRELVKDALRTLWKGLTGDSQP
jgi:hypothetical protein